MLIFAINIKLYYKTRTIRLHPKGAKFSGEYTEIKDGNRNSEIKGKEKNEGYEEKDKMSYRADVQWLLKDCENYYIWEV